MSNNNNNDLDKETVEIALSSDVGNTQHDCNPATIKLVSFGNIPFVLHAKDFKGYKKAVDGVRSLSTECNSSIIKEIESSSAEYNLLIV